MIGISLVDACEKGRTSAWNRGNFWGRIVSDWHDGPTGLSSILQTRILPPGGG